MTIFAMYDIDSANRTRTRTWDRAESMLLPDMQDSQHNTWQLAVGAGKDGNIYVADRAMMGKFNTNNDCAIYQEIDSNGLSGGVWSMPAYFNNVVYYGAVGDYLKRSR